MCCVSDPDHVLIWLYLFMAICRQILPIFNLFRAKNSNLGDEIDYNQRSRLNIGELIMETLNLMEQFGGPNAFINIKVSMQCVYSVHAHQTV